MGRMSTYGRGTAKCGAMGLKFACGRAATIPPTIAYDSLIWFGIQFA